MRVHTDSGIKFIEIFVFVVVEFSLHLSHFATYLELSAQGNGDKIYSSVVYHQRWSRKKLRGVSLQINRSLESVWMVLSDQQVTTQTALPIRSYNNKKININ